MIKLRILQICVDYGDSLDKNYKLENLKTLVLGRAIPGWRISPNGLVTEWTMFLLIKIQGIKNPRALTVRPVILTGQI